MSETGSHITKVEAVGLPVTDQDRALEFYLGKLGFEKRRDVPFGPAGRWIEVAPPGAVTTIALVPAGMPAGVRLTTWDAEGDHASLRAQGVDTDPEIMHMGGAAPPMFSFRDPGRQQPADHPGQLTRQPRPASLVRVAKADQAVVADPAVGDDAGARLELPLTNGPSASADASASTAIRRRPVPSARRSRPRCQPVRP